MAVGFKLQTDFHGPLFDGRAEAEIKSFAMHLDRVLSDKAVRDIRAYLPTQYKYLGHNRGNPVDNPVPPNAGFLAAMVRSDRVSDNMILVTNSRVVYGPWIEGITSRNAQFRFPGYHTFRLIAQQINAEAQAIANRELPVYIKEMNS